MGRAVEAGPALLAAASRSPTSRSGALHHRGATVQGGLAASRGHQVEHSRVMPTLGNCSYGDRLRRRWEIHADAIRVVPFGAPAVVEGKRVRYTPAVERTWPVGSARERFVRDFARFAWFADGFVARDPADPTVLADMRYSLDPGEFEPLWGVRFHTRRPGEPVSG